MEPNAIFNITVCAIGIAFFLIHAVNILLKKDKRKDEISLLIFFLFTAFHLSIYLAYTFLKSAFPSDALIMGFYTAFYTMNNLELLFFFLYAIHYIAPKKKVADILSIINFSMLGVFLILDFINLFTHFFFYAENGAYVRAPTMFLSQGYQFLAFGIVFVLALSDKRLDRTEKTAFALYCFLPIVAIVLQNLLPGYAIAYLSIIVSIEILFLFASQRKNAALEEQARKAKEAELLLMASQIQPHFIYNSLSAVSTLIEIDPKKAQKALDDFTEYLRMNLSVLSDTRLVLFNDELHHVELYLSLEKVRFEERLNVIYEIESRDFLLPPLTLQPLVENAVKHGILRKAEGGTVVIRAYEDDSSHRIEVSDDGVGFDTNLPKEKGHIGLENVRYRIQSMCDGKLLIESEVGSGSKLTIILPKGGKYL